MAAVDKDKYLPLQLSTKNYAHVDILSALVIADLPFDIDGSTKPMHAFSWMLIMDGRDIQVNDAIEIVKRVFLLHPKLVKELSHFKDLKGRDAFSLAHADIQALMKQFLFFLCRFEFVNDTPVIRTDATVVYLAKDYTSSLTQNNKSSFPVVALKFMKDKADFEKEISTRKTFALDESFVVSILDSFDGDAYGGYQEAISRMSVISGYMYCIVMSDISAFRTLKSAMDSDFMFFTNDDNARDVAKKLCTAVAHIAKRGLAHGHLTVS